MVSCNIFIQFKGKLFEGVVVILTVYNARVILLVFKGKLFEGVVVISREEKEFLEHIARRLDLLAEYISACHSESGVTPEEKEEIKEKALVSWPERKANDGK